MVSSDGPPLAQRRGKRYSASVSEARDIVSDSERRGLIGALPPALRPFASLARIDRPIGIWLLFWPCAWSVALAGVRGEWASAPRPAAAGREMIAAAAPGGAKASWHWAGMPRNMSAIGMSRAPG